MGSIYMQYLWHGGNTMDCAKVGRLIMQLRKEKGMTQQQVADLLGISNKTVSKWERGVSQS
jgi:DNA-binding transcriptional regulator YiaG